MCLRSSIVEAGPEHIVVVRVWGLGIILASHEPRRGTVPSSFEREAQSSTTALGSRCMLKLHTVTVN